MTSGRRGAMRAAAGWCCGVSAALATFRAPQALAGVTAPAGWPQPVQDLWLEAWNGVEPPWVADVHLHLLGDTATQPRDDAAWIHPRTTRPWAFGEWVRRRAIEHASGVAGSGPQLSSRYVERLAELWQPFPAGSRPLLLAFDAVIGPDGLEDLDRTMFTTGNAYAAGLARERGWGWIASIHPDRRDAIERLRAARARGARAVKWLPSAQGIDPSQPRHVPFYREMVALGLPLLSHAGEELAVPGAREYDWINPLLLRRPLEQGVNVIVAHCASLGEAVDLDAPGRPRVPAFSLFARLMDDPSLGPRVHGDLSAVTQVNRRPEVLRTLLERRDWHARLLWGSDYPLPAIDWLTSASRLARAGLLDESRVEAIEQLQLLNPLAFDFVLKRTLAAGGSRFAASVFETARLLR
jgi:mannonate dehydratase